MLYLKYFENSTPKWDSFVKEVSEIFYILQDENHYVSFFDDLDTKNRKIVIQPSAVTRKFVHRQSPVEELIYPDGYSGLDIFNKLMEVDEISEFISRVEEIGKKYNYNFNIGFNGLRIIMNILNLHKQPIIAPTN